MLAALLMFFFLGGAGVHGTVLTPAMLDDLDARMEAALVDPVRTERAAAQNDALRAELKQFEKTYGKSSKTLTKLYRDHAADAIAMRAELDALDSHWEAAQSRALDHRFALRDSLTREEWEAVFGDR